MLRTTLLMLALIGIVSPLSAADKNQNAWTEPPKGDADYEMQGEYLGSIVDDCCRCVPVGLQVVALGDGEFQAVEYSGGLPGYGWPIGGKRLKFKGTREDATLTLTGETQQITIQNGQATIKRLGEYERVVGNACFVERASGTLGACPPCNSIVLFDGSNTDLLKNGEIVDGGLLKEGFETKDAYGDFRLHLEFRLPYMPKARGQGRSNSGVYLQSRYEVQILDSFGLEGEFNECGALYRERKPDLNMCLPPLVWQTYDIWFQAARFDADGKKIQDAHLTAWLNGVPVHDDLDVPTPTGGGKRVGEKPFPLPTKFQNHSNPVRFRNMWIVSYDPPKSSDAGQSVAVRGQRPEQVDLATLSGTDR
ncbi:MAG: 3-keto-disaccharide hydrolase [Planctomycetota bacterium]|jgi:hypothetical protein